MATLISDFWPSVLLFQAPGPWCSCGRHGTPGQPGPGELFPWQSEWQEQGRQPPQDGTRPSSPGWEEGAGAGGSPRGRGGRDGASEGGAHDSPPAALGRRQALVIRGGASGCLLKSLPQVLCGLVGRHVCE